MILKYDYNYGFLNYLNDYVYFPNNYVVNNPLSLLN